MEKGRKRVLPALSLRFCVGQPSMRMRASAGPRDFANIMPNWNASFSCDPDIVVGTSGLTGQTKHAVAFFQKAMCSGMHDRMIGVTSGRASTRSAKNGQRGPFADHGNVSESEDGVGGLLQSGEVCGHLGRVIACA